MTLLLVLLPLLSPTYQGLLCHSHQYLPLSGRQQATFVYMLTFISVRLVGWLQFRCDDVASRHAT